MQIIFRNEGRNFFGISKHAEVKLEEIKGFILLQPSNKKYLLSFPTKRRFCSHSENRMMLKYFKNEYKKSNFSHVCLTLRPYFLHTQAYSEYSQVKKNKWILNAPLSRLKHNKNKSNLIVFSYFNDFTILIRRASLNHSQVNSSGIRSWKSAAARSKNRTLFKLFFQNEAFKPKCFCVYKQNNKPNTKINSLMTFIGMKFK